MKDGRRFGRPPTPYTPPPTPRGKVNVTDPDSRNVKTPRGYMQGYNAQGVCNEHQIVVAAELNTDSPDFGHLEPMVRAAERELTAAGVSEKPRVVVADAGYWHHDQMDDLAGRGVTVLVPPDAGKRTRVRPGWDGGRYAFMRRVLETDRGRQLYGKRQTTIEPVFAHTKFNRRLDRFLRRGIGLPVGMAPYHRHPQPAQAPQPPDRRCRRLTAPSPRRPSTSTHATQAYAPGRDLCNSHDESQKPALRVCFLTNASAPGSCAP